MVAEAKRADAVWYPESDEMGEHELQRFIAEVLRGLIERWLREHGRVAHAGADQFFYWQQGDPKKGRAPDVYVVDGVAQDIPEVGCWKTWEGHRPAFALEVCGERWQKDYDEAPEHYRELGTSELIVFDPGATPRSRRRVRWQVFREVQGRGFSRVQRHAGDRVWSEVLGCFLREVEDRGHRRLRLATGDLGLSLFPTAEEAANQLVTSERAQKEAERAQKEAERAQKEAERAQKEAALVEVERLRAELERLRSGR